MSQDIDDALEILERVWVHSPVVGGIRSRYVRQLAKQRKVSTQTIHANMLRALRANVLNARALDRLIARWWGGDGSELRAALMAGARTSSERTKIDALFPSRGGP